MNLIEKALVFAILGGLGLTAIIAQLVPGQPALRDALDRLAGKPAEADVDIDADLEPAATRVQQWTQQVGLAAYPALARLPVLRIPTQDLAILRRSPARFLGDKILSSGLGLITPAALNLGLMVSGLTMPWQLPAIVGVALAAGLWFAPDIEVRQRAAAARAQFRRALGAYVELAAYSRNAGIGVTQSLETAAGVADTWTFRRLSEALAEASYAGRTSWSALETVGKELGIAELTDVAHTMELSGTHGSSVYDTLRALASGMRNQMLASDQGTARSTTQKMAVPLGALVVVFIVIVVLPGFHVF